ncbi:MAG: endonuclease [Dysgonamonadaceae bacterium]|nr:endonuclease [Dysgonamonadaceae bacterium]
MFYNVENLFDTENDPHKNDNEFLPEGIKHWTGWRYRNKINKIAGVISVAGEGWKVPDVVGLCEVENDSVIINLTRYSSLGKWGYRYVMTDSPDMRGIDVALLYRQSSFKYLSHECYRIKFPNNKSKKTRDILHVTGLVAGGDTIDIFVCHFPSRRGGEKISEKFRVYTASVVKANIDRLRKTRPNVKVIIMGDFNDEPSDRSIRETLGAVSVPAAGDTEPDSLYNLFAHYEKKKNEGTYKYQRRWYMLDQILVSGNLLNQERRFRVLPNTAQIFVREYMLTEDKTKGGKRPKKSFYGAIHEGGYSDHLPVIVDFSTGKK